MWWIYQRRSGTCLGLYLCQLCWPNEQSNLLCSRSSRKSPRVWLSSTCRQFLADIACRSDTERAPTSVFCDVNCRHHTKSTANHHAAAEEDEEGRRLSLTVRRGSLVCMIIPTWLMIQFSYNNRNKMALQLTFWTRLFFWYFVLRLTFWTMPSIRVQLNNILWKVSRHPLFQ